MPDNTDHAKTEALQRFFENQSKELQVRSKEFALRERELDHAAKYSQKALDAQLEDRKDARAMRLKEGTTKYKAVVVLVVLVLGFGGYALYLNKDAIVIEAVKIAGIAVAGFFGGYHYGRNKERTSPPKDSNADE